MEDGPSVKRTVGAEVLDLPATAHRAAANDMQADPLCASVSGLNLLPMIGSTGKRQIKCRRSHTLGDA